MTMPMAPPPPTLPIQYNGPPNGSHPPPPQPTQTQMQNQNQNHNYNRPPSPPRRNRPSRSPSFSQQQNKRQRPSPSYNPPPRDERPINRYPSAGSGPPPAPYVPPPTFVPPPRAPPRASPAPSHGHDGLAPALPWFIGQLPNNRSYDGMSLSFTLAILFPNPTIDVVYTKSQAQ